METSLKLKIKNKVKGPSRIKIESNRNALPVGGRIQSTVQRYEWDKHKNMI